MSDLIFLRDAYDANYVESSMSLFGIFSDRNRDVSEFVNKAGIVTDGGRAHIFERRQYAEEIERDGVKYFKYHLVVPINHGLARQEKPLPSGSVLHCCIFLFYYK